MIAPVRSRVVSSVPGDVRRELDALVGELAERFVDAGHRFYLVGGIVRDVLLGRWVSAGDADDIDVTTDATPGQVRVVLQGWADTIWDQGERFGTVGARRRDVVMEITTHRAERYDPKSRKPEVDFSRDVVDDLSRRDFTVNSMAVELPVWELVDPYGGQQDLTIRVLRTPIDPAASFTDDPLRMLRAARFATRYGLSPVDDLRDAMARYCDRLDIVSRERISEELRKFFAVPTAASGVELLRSTGVLDRVAPDLGSITPSQLLAFDRVGPDATLRWAVLLWSRRDDLDAAAATLRHLRESTSFIRSVTSVLRAATALEGATGASIVDARRTIVTAGSELDSGRTLVAALDVDVDVELLRQIDVVIGSEGAHTLRSPLDGSEVMAATGLEGREVGSALAYLLERRIVDGPLSSIRATELVRAWAAGR